jgi:D-beta-D-heptose 7-phosphate kinase/D-beta-D-heptose 1-phosphate adenosyltransferase
MKILVIGETCKDVFCYGKSERLAPEAPAPVFVPLSTITNPGMAMNVQKNILSLDCECDIVTNDNWEEIVKTRYIHKNTNQMFLRIDENDDTIERCDVKQIPLKKYDMIIVSDYCKGFLTEKDIRWIGANHDCVLLDTKKQLGDWCNTVDYIKINNSEYRRSEKHITGTLRSKLIVTLGEKGCRYLEKIYPVKSVEIKDVSGAGDTFIAGLAVKYLQTQDMDQAITFANHCATNVVQRRGVNTL